MKKQENATYRYYFTSEPPMPGSCPTENLVNVVSFPLEPGKELYRPWIDDLECRAWGYADYSHPLPEWEQDNYSLYPKRKWFRVVCFSNDGGHSWDVKVGGYHTAVLCPADKELRDGGRLYSLIYWYGSLKEAREFVKRHYERKARKENK